MKDTVTQIIFVQAEFDRLSTIIDNPYLNDFLQQNTDGCFFLDADFEQLEMFVAGYFCVSVVI